MDNSIIYVAIALLAGSVGSVLIAGVLLFIRQPLLDKITGWLLSFAGGTLLGAAFIGMLPKAISLATSHATILNWVLGGIIGLFVLEKLILWHKCNNKNCERHSNASAPLILIGDAFHNFIDGVIIAASFSTSVPFGFFVTLTVFAHEIPQELSDFGILLRSGYSRKKALWYNTLSGSTAIPGGIIAYYAFDKVNNYLPYVLAISAASFIYIALADLVPQMHNKTKPVDSALQVCLIVSGIGIIYILKHIT